jgi:hypothetical protein
MGTETLHLHTVVDQDGGAILDVEQGQITTLNSTGAFVWQALQRGEAVESIVRTIIRETGEAALTVECDVRGFVQSLREKNLLRQ